MEIKDIISSGLLELHATGIASEAESAQVLQWCAQYPEVKEEVDEIERAMETYIMSHAIEPASGLREIVLNKITPASQSEFSNQPAPVVQMSSHWKNVAAASIVLLLGSAILNFVYFGKLKESHLAYQQNQQELVAANDRLNGMMDDISVVRNKYSQPVSLDGLAPAPEAAAKIFWMKNTGDVYIDPSNLPAAPAGMQYQLWAIVDGKPVDGGLIITTKNEDKFRIQKMKGFGKVKVDAFAVTLETSGGNPTPKGEMYVMGKM